MGASPSAAGPPGASASRPALSTPQRPRTGSPAVSPARRAHARGARGGAAAAESESRDRQGRARHRAARSGPRHRSFRLDGRQPGARIAGGNARRRSAEIRGVTASAASSTARDGRCIRHASGPSSTKTGRACSVRRGSSGWPPNTLSWKSGRRRAAPAIISRPDSGGPTFRRPNGPPTPRRSRTSAGTGTTTSATAGRRSSSSAARWTRPCSPRGSMRAC